MSTNRIFAVPYGEAFETGRRLGRSDYRRGTVSPKVIEYMTKYLDANDLPLGVWGQGHMHGYHFGWVEAVIIDGRKADRDSAPVQAPGE